MICSLSHSSFDVVDQFTINPSRASEITIAEDITTTGGDMFGGEFGEFDLGGGEFGGGWRTLKFLGPLRVWHLQMRRIKLVGYLCRYCSIVCGACICVCIPPHSCITSK